MAGRGRDYCDTLGPLAWGETLMLDAEQVLPSQWDHGMASGMAPERALLLGVLGQAIRDVQAGRPGMTAQVVAWMAARGSGAVPFGFLCRHLGIDPDWLETKMLRLIREPRRLKVLRSVAGGGSVGQGRTFHRGNG